MTDSTIVEIMLGVLTVMIGVGAYLGAARAQGVKAVGVSENIESDAYERARSIYEGAIKSMESHIDRLRSETAELASEIAKLRESNMDLQASNRQLQASNALLSQQIEELQKERRSLD